MTPLSARFAAPALAVLVAAAAAVWMRALAPPVADACSDALGAGSVAALPGTLAARERPDLRGAHSQWTEGEIAAPSRDVAPLRFRIVSNFDPRFFYTEPTPYFSMNSTPDARRGIRWLDAGDDRIPVHWRYDDSEATYVVNHLFVQDGRPVRHPLVAGVANAARQVLRGPRPITLLLVDGLGPSSRREAIERSAEEWLRAAWHRYSAECRG